MRSEPGNDPRGGTERPPIRAHGGLTRPAFAVPLVTLLVLALSLAGCASPRSGPHPIAPGTPCAACGMRIEDLRYACEEEWDGALRVYDSIECLLRADPAPERAWLADYDTRTLHAADSMWVVRGEIPSPMGGGYAAFLDRAAALEIATLKTGQVARLAEFAPASAVSDPAAPGPRDSLARQP